MSRYTIASGPFSGWQLRLTSSGAVEAHSGTATGKWTRAPLRGLARAYAVGEGPWPWLLEHGIRRPSPSGSSGATQPEGERLRKQRLLRLSDDELEALDAVAERWGVSRSDAVARLAREELER